MQCTISEATKALEFKSRNSLYRLKEKGVLKDYLSTINGQKYLEMGKVKESVLEMVFFRVYTDQLNHGHSSK